MPEILELLHQCADIAKNPRAQLDRYLEEGTKVIGCVPEYTPEEVIHAMGLVPFGCWGGDGEVAEAKAYFPAFYCGLVQTVLELGIKGTYEGLSAMVIPNFCDSLKALSQNWKYAVPSIPMVFVSYPQNRRTRAGRDFTRAAYERLASDLYQFTGAKLSEEALLLSLEVYNEHNALLREFSELAAECSEVTPSLRMGVFKSAYFVRKEEHNELLRELNQALRETADDGPSIRLVTTGILADASGLLEVLEQNGMGVVGDDVAHESRQYRVDAVNGATAVDRLVDKFANMHDCCVLYDAEKIRGTALVQLAKQRRADGVVIAMTKFCDPDEFDYVPLKRDLDSAGIRSVTVEVDRQMDRYDQVQTAVETFRDMVRP